MGVFFDSCAFAAGSRIERLLVFLVVVLVHLVLVVDPISSLCLDCLSLFYIAESL